MRELRQGGVGTTSILFSRMIFLLYNGRTSTREIDMRMLVIAGVAVVGLVVAEQIGEFAQQVRFRKKLHRIMDNGEWLEETMRRCREQGVVNNRQAFRRVALETAEDMMIKF